MGSDSLADHTRNGDSLFGIRTRYRFPITRIARFHSIPIENQDVSYLDIRIDNQTNTLHQQT